MKSCTYLGVLVVQRFVNKLSHNLGDRRENPIIATDAVFPDSLTGSITIITGNSTNGVTLTDKSFLSHHTLSVDLNSWRNAFQR